MLIPPRPSTARSRKPANSVPTSGNSGMPFLHPRSPRHPATPGGWLPRAVLPARLGEREIPDFGSIRGYLLVNRPGIPSSVGQDAVTETGGGGGEAALVRTTGFLLISRRARAGPA